MLQLSAHQNRIKIECPKNSLETAKRFVWVPTTVRHTGYRGVLAENNEQGSPRSGCVCFVSEGRAAGQGARADWVLTGHGAALDHLNLRHHSSRGQPCPGTRPPPGSAGRTARACPATAQRGRKTAMRGSRSMLPVEGFLRTRTGPQRYHKRSAPRPAPCAAKRRRGCAAACRGNNADRGRFVVLHATCVTALRRFLTVLRCRALAEDESKSR